MGQIGRTIPILNGPIASWEGVLVSSDKILRISLGSNNITGPFPDTLTTLSDIHTIYLYDNNLSGSIPEDIGHMKELQTLSINSNQLEGEIPESIGECSNLRLLFIDNNNISGSLPATMANLKNLERVRLNQTNLSGPLPNFICGWTSLDMLTLGNANFSGPIPPCIDSLVNLKSLYLLANSFSGPFPTIHNLKKLENISISYQPLEGKLDEILGVHPFLRTVGVTNTNITGAISNHHYKGDIIERLELEGSQFTEIDDFSSFADTGVLQRLWVTRNSLNFDDLAPNAPLTAIDFLYVAQSPVGEADTIYLNNGEDYTIHSPMQNANIQYIWMKDGDTLSGANGDSLIISNFAESKSGSYYFISTHPDFPGLEISRKPITIYPRKFVSEGDSLALVHLYNTTNGPNWSNKAHWLSGPVAIWYGIEVKNSRVSRIDLYKNNLIGSLPDTLSSLTQLEYLDLADNMLTGILPENLGRLENLTFLRLNSNQLEGEIPESLGECIQLENLNLHNNNLSGTIPASLSSLTKLYYLVVYKNNFSGPFPEVLLSMKRLETLNISNALSG